MTELTPLPRWRNIVSRFQFYYFALIMATGIVCLGCFKADFRSLSYFLLALNSVQYAVCFLLGAAKVALMPGSLWQGLTDASRGPGYLTLVAATSILGQQYVQLTSFTLLPTVLLIMGCLFYLVLIFSMLSGVAMAEHKSTFSQGLDGSWLLCTVSGCSVVILGMGAQSHLSAAREAFLIGLWAASIMLYCIIIPLIFYRWLFTTVNRKDFSPSWWINMGALAIAALAGESIVSHGGTENFAGMMPIILAATWFLWASALWWLCLLMAIVVWRFVSRTLDFRYAPANWSMVFPAGMMAVTSFNVMEMAHIVLPALAIKLVIGLIILLWLIVWCSMFVAIMAPESETGDSVNLPG